METAALSNGVQMPVLGYGVYQVDPAECERCVSDAISAGYRSIDTAQAYCNEEGVGRAVAKSGIPREEFFITTKVWVSNAGYERAKASIDASLKKLGTGYIDLLLVHQPIGDYYGTWRAMEEAYKGGKLRAIGVSNFYPDRLADICCFVEILPMVNQVETHIFQQQAKARKTMDKYNVRHESWGPFAEGRKGFFTNEKIAAVAARHGKTIAQVALRFLLQSGVIVIPKTTHKERMEENINVFDFSLTEADMNELRELDEGESAFLSHHDPDTVEFLANFGK